jgi:Polyketide cyclase / dehydrase and lipid transport
MTQTFHFERFHEIVIQAPADSILDYVSNPNSWPQWIASSHEIDSPDRPLQAGDVFGENWATRTGKVTLDWKVLARDHSRMWEAQTRTDFTGPIVVRYEVEAVEGGHLFRRRLINPARSKMPTEDMIRRIDEEAVISLQNIKRNVEALSGG